MINAANVKLGRPRACPPAAALEVLRLSATRGMGSRAIATELRRRGIDVSRRTVQRVLSRQGVYETPAENES